MEKRLQKACVRVKRQSLPVVLDTDAAGVSENRFSRPTAGSDWQLVLSVSFASFRDTRTPCSELTANAAHFSFSPDAHAAEGQTAAGKIMWQLNISWENVMGIQYRVVEQENATR